jgi:hypothetical protein
MPCSRIFHIYAEVTITGEGLQNLEGQPHSVAFYDTQADAGDIF